MMEMRRFDVRLRQPIRRPLTSSFCGQHRDEVERLVAGPGVYICSESIVLAVGELAKSRQS
jgi:hypothetical protein